MQQKHDVPAAGFLFREKEPPLNVRKERIAEYGLSIAQIAAAKRAASAFVQQRAKISERAFPHLFQTLNRTFDRDCRYEMCIRDSFTSIHFDFKPSCPIRSIT